MMAARKRLEIKRRVGEVTCGACGEKTFEYVCIDIVPSEVPPYGAIIYIGLDCIRKATRKQPSVREKI